MVRPRQPLPLPQNFEVAYRFSEIMSQGYPKPELLVDLIGLISFTSTWCTVGNVLYGKVVYHYQQKMTTELPFLHYFFLCPVSLSLYWANFNFQDPLKNS